MTILAFEPDSVRAATIRRIVSGLNATTLTLVQSKAHLINELQTEVPDVVLLPVLLSPKDEAELLTHIRALACSHVETLFTPFAFAERQQPVQTSWFSRRSTRKARSIDSACEPHVFAERLSWAVRRARSIRLEHEERLRFERELLAATPSLALTRRSETDNESSIWLEDAAISGGVSFSASDRRAHRRFTGGELPGLRVARLRSGPMVRLVDVSAKGALLETDSSLRPESEASLELVSHARELVVPLRVLRCQVSGLKGQLLYQGACVFEHELEFEDLLVPGSDDGVRLNGGVSRFDLSIKEAVDNHVRAVDGEHSLPDLTQQLKTISDSRRPGEPGFGALRDLMTLVTSALENRDQLTGVIGRIEDHLNAVVPGARIQFVADQARSPKTDRETIFFQVPTVLDIPHAVLAVELRQGSILEDWQFRLLRASTYLVALVPPIPVEARFAHPATYGDSQRQASAS